MMLSIQGLPPNTTYQDLKRLIKQECNITDFILDCLMLDDDGCKKVRIGVTDDSVGSQLMKYLNGYQWLGYVMRISPVGKPIKQSSFDQRPAFQPRNDYQSQPVTNFGNRAMPQDSQPHTNWVSNAQWNQPAPVQVPQNTFPNQQIQPPVANTSYTHSQQERGSYGQGRPPQQQQSFGYPPKTNIPANTGVSHFGNQSGASQGHYQSQPNVTQPWTPQVQPVKPQQFDKPPPVIYGQMGYNDNRHMEKQNMGNDSGYKDYDKGERRFNVQTRDPSPGGRMSPRRRTSPGPASRMDIGRPQGRRLSPGNSHGRGMSPTGPQGRRVSPAGPQGRRLSPLAPHGRRMSPTNILGRGMAPQHERRISPPAHRGSPPRMSPGQLGRRMSPPQVGGVAGRGISLVGRLGQPHIKMSPGPPGRRMSPGPPGRRMSPGPPGRRMSPGPSGRRMSPGPSGRRMSPGPSGRRMSPGPHGRRMSPGPSGRRLSPDGYGRKMSPGPARRMSPPPRRMSPGRDLPLHRRMSPTDRRMGGRSSPNRHISPPRRMSPARHSPGRRSLSPQSALRGYAPPFHQAKKPKYDDDDRSLQLKQVRPAYEPSEKAANQPMYSGGYRPNVHDNQPYNTPVTRLDPWQQNTDNSSYPSNKTMDGRIEKFDIPRTTEHLRMGEADTKRSRSRTRDSRSPGRRDRSPIKDRYRRHSPSPRSPRRSWALEKRRSPDIRDAPPPPIWPGQNLGRDSKFQNKPHVPTWERPSYEDNDDELRHIKGSDGAPASFSHNNPNHIQKWKPISQSKDTLPRNVRDSDRFPENTRDKYESKDEFDLPVDPDRMQYTSKRDFRDYPMKKDDRDELRHNKDIPPRRDNFLREDDRGREDFHTNSLELNKEIEDVYKRVAELGKKAQEYRKKESRFDDRGEQFYNRNEGSAQRGQDARRDFDTTPRYQGREDGSKARHSDEGERSGRQRESRWGSVDVVWKSRMSLNSYVKAKRDKAAAELTRRIMTRFENEINENLKIRVRDELNLSFMRLFRDMFKDEDVSYIEIIIRYNKKFTADDEAKMFEEVMSSFPNSYRKRPALDQPDIPAKTYKRSPDHLARDKAKGDNFHNVPSQAVPEWNIAPMAALTVPVNAMSSSTVAPSVDNNVNVRLPFYVNPTPLMVPAPAYDPTLNAQQESGLISNKGCHNLYLCKHDFQPFDDYQIEMIKSFLVSQMLEESKNTEGWAPDFIMKGLQTVFRYEIVTYDKRSKEWLINLDFSAFDTFNVLVYSGEEIWYERAAIWLPGHSRCRHIEPLRKLKLQNAHLNNIQIGKWKFVTKVVTLKGTRIYVDMPPSDGRVLEKNKLMLSYELQKVSVFLKSVAVDKEAFDAGLNEPSVEVVPSMQVSTMPSLGQDANIVKIGIKGNKHTTLVMARKIKDLLVYRLYHYLLHGGKSRTDFVKYGFCPPGYLGVLPGNTESRRWLIGLNLGTINRQRIVVINGDENNIKYINMFVMLPNEPNIITNSLLALEKLKLSNQGVKGINFTAWRNPKLTDRYDGKIKFEVEMDLQSVETIISLDYELDYVDEGQECMSVAVRSPYSDSKLDEIIKEYKAEMSDTYDVANMEIASDSDNDVVCLD